MLIYINPKKPQQDKIKKTVQLLKSGGIIVYPTDTIYGIGCDIFNKNAVEKIYKIKERSTQKAMSILCANMKEVKKYCFISNEYYKLLEKLLPGSYTFILKAKKNVPKTFLPKNSTVGIRIPNNKIALEIVKALGKPIITTSVNISGKESMNNPKEIEKKLGKKIDLIINSDPISGTASTVIDLTKKKPIVLRKGAGLWNEKKYNI